MKEPLPAGGDYVLTQREIERAIAKIRVVASALTPVTQDRQAKSLIGVINELRRQASRLIVYWDAFAVGCLVDEAVRRQAPGRNIDIDVDEVLSELEDSDELDGPIGELSGAVRAQVARIVAKRLEQPS